LQGRGGNNEYCPWQSSTVLWHLGSVPRKSSSGNTLTRSQIESIFADAFDEWENHCELQAAQTTQRGSAFIKINFVSKAEKPNEFPQTGDMARAYPPCPHEGKKGKVYFRIVSDSPWTEDELYKFAVHEFGHALGMNFHSGDSDDAMYQDPTIWNNSLTENDITHIKVLYPRGKQNEHNIA